MPGHEKLAGVPAQAGPSLSLPPMHVSPVHVPEYTEIRLSQAAVPQRLTVWMLPVLPGSVYHTPAVDWTTPHVVVPSSVPVLVPSVVRPATVVLHERVWASHTR